MELRLLLKLNTETMLATATVLNGIILAAPTAAWISDAATAQAVFEIDQVGAIATNRVVGRASLSPTVGSDGKFTSTLEQVDFEIAAGDITDGQIDSFAFAPFADGLTYAQFWIANAALVQLSAVSNTVSKTIVTANAGSTMYPYLLV